MKVSERLRWTRPLGLELLHLVPQPLDFRQLWFHHAVARKRLSRIVVELLYPLEQNDLMHVEITRCMRHRNVAIMNKAHRLQLELPRETPSSHTPPPVSS